jgi:hypothetical protein
MCEVYIINPYTRMHNNTPIYIAPVRCLYFNEVACNTIQEHVSKTGSIFVKQITVNTGSWLTCCSRQTRENVEKLIARLRMLATSSNCVRSASCLYATKLTTDLSVTHSEDNSGCYMEASSWPFI